MSTYDNYKPNGSWTFDSGVTEVFENMLSRSIPNYEGMRDTVSMVAAAAIGGAHYPQNFLDIGCSRGEVIRRVLQNLPNKDLVHTVGVDNSPEMIDAAVKEFADSPNVQFVLADAADIYISAGKYDLITSVLTAQFIPLDERQEFYGSVHNGLSPDGVFILVEKVLGESVWSNHYLVDTYHRMKVDNGYSHEQVEEKRKALQGVLVPLRASENERMLQECGFRNVQRIWQCLNFAGWMATK